jgi:hypothetical protein
MNIGNTINFFLIIIPSYWEAIGVITPEDKDLNFAVEKKEEFQIHFYTIK